MSLSSEEGAGKAGCRLAPAVRAQKRTRCGPQGSRDIPAFPARMVLTVSFVISPVRRALLPPSPRGSNDASHPVGVRSSPRNLTPASGARTTRLRRPRTSSPKLSTAGVCSPSKPNEDASQRRSFARRSIAHGFKAPALRLPARRRRRVHRIPPRVPDDRDTPLVPGRTNRHIRQFRNSEKKNIFTGGA